MGLMDIPRFRQDCKIREEGHLNFCNYSISPGNTINPQRHDGRPSVTANQKQMSGDCALSAVLPSQLFAAGDRERA